MNSQIQSSSYPNNSHFFDYLPTNHENPDVSPLPVTVSGKGIFTLFKLLEKIYVPLIISQGRHLILSIDNYWTSTFNFLVRYQVKQNSGLESDQYAGKLKARRRRRGNGTHIEISGIHVRNINFDGDSGGGNAESLYRCGTNTIHKRRRGSPVQGIILVLEPQKPQLKNRNSESNGLQKISSASG